MKVLLITPPLLQPNTPYAATPLLTAWLRSQGHDAVQADLSLELLLKLFSKDGLTELFQTLENTEEAADFLEQADAYLETIEPVVAFLQGKSDSLNIALPEGPHLARAYEQEEQLGWNFRGLNDEDRARHLCSLYLDDVAEAFKLADPNFGFSRYAEHLSATAMSFEILLEKARLTGDGSPYLNDSALMGRARRSAEPYPGFFFQCLEKLMDEVMAKHQPELVVLTVPFPGCLIGALTIAKQINHTFQSVVKIAMGGGYVNTELRELSDPQVFDFVDTICLDSGMTPLLRIANGETPVRTFVREEGAVRFYEDDGEPVPYNELPPPVFDGLPLDDYFGLFEVLNPVTRLWSDGRWNKLVLAHGCCWSRCAFCDTSVDYICRYDPAVPATICDWMEAMMAESGFNGFHFVDEALPPDLLDGLCDEILKRDLDVEWWGNIRFEKQFSNSAHSHPPRPSLCSGHPSAGGDPCKSPPAEGCPKGGEGCYKTLAEKMARAGCIAVTGGLETCCDRTLNLMRKGITVEGASEVLRNFANAGILTHAYLMYGFPTQTKEEVFQGLETVRQLVDEGALHSAFWHRFALTAHSEIARDPERFGIRLLPEERTGFARNEIPFEGEFDHDLEAVGAALRAATYNYQLGLGLDQPVDQWLKMSNNEQGTVEC